MRPSMHELPETMELDPHDSAFTHVLYVVRTGGVFMHGVAGRAAHFSSDAAVRADKGVMLDPNRFRDNLIRNAPSQA